MKLVACLVVLIAIVSATTSYRRAHIENIDASQDGAIANYVLSAMNKTVNPCDDFYEYSCGTWISTFTLPPSDSSYPRNIGQISANNNEILISICENPANGKVTFNRFTFISVLFNLNF